MIVVVDAVIDEPAKRRVGCFPSTEDIAEERP